MSNSGKELESLLKKYREICTDLNMNRSATDEALLSFNRIGNNYSLEVSVDCCVQVIEMICN